MNLFIKIFGSNNISSAAKKTRYPKKQFAELQDVL